MNETRPGLMPKARKDRLIIKELPDEILVYDLDTDKAHCLNQTASMVWKNCDGEQSIASLSASLSQQEGVEVDEGVVWLALDSLQKFNLLAEAPTVPPLFAAISRRQLIRKISVTAIALPLIMTIAAPAAQAQASCIAGNNSPCTIGGTPCCAPRTCQAQPTGGPLCRP